MPITASDIVRFIARAVLAGELDSDAVLRMPDELPITSLHITNSGQALILSDDEDEDGR